MTKEGIFSKDYVVKQKLTPYFRSASEFKQHLLRNFGTYKEAGSVAGYDESRIHQIASGYKVPKNPDIIKRLSDVWNIDLVVLTALFEKLRLNLQTEQKGEGSTSPEPEEVKDD